MIMGSIAPIGSGRLTPRQALRRWGNWFNLSTPLGLVIARFGGARVTRGPRGLYLAERYRRRFPIASAFTVGDVVITGGNWNELLAGRPKLLLHEERHSWQYLYCGGLPFFPLYGLAMFWSYLSTRSIARGNVFECAAGLADGGYL